MGVVVNASLSMVKTNSQSLEKWIGVSLAMSEDTGLATLLKSLINLR